MNFVREWRPPPDSFRCQRCGEYRPKPGEYVTKPGDAKHQVRVCTPCAGEIEMSESKRKAEKARASIIARAHLGPQCIYVIGSRIGITTDGSARHKQLERRDDWPRICVGTFDSRVDAELLAADIRAVMA